MLILFAVLSPAYLFACITYMLPTTCPSSNSFAYYQSADLFDEFMMPEHNTDDHRRSASEKQVIILLCF